MQKRQFDIDRERLSYERAVTTLKVQRNKAAAQTELDAFYRYYGAICMLDIDPEKVKADAARRSVRQYEEMLGFKIGSDEYNRRLAYTLNALQNMGKD